MAGRPAIQPVNESFILPARMSQVSSMHDGLSHPNDRHRARGILHSETLDRGKIRRKRSGRSFADREEAAGVADL